jgi:hypothetical protein
MGGRAQSSLQAEGPFVERRETLHLDSGGTLTLRLLLQPDHVAHAPRIIEAARESLNQYSEWFSPYPHNLLTIVDRRWQSTNEDPVEVGAVPIRAHWLQPERSLTLEADVARGIARQWWGGVVQVEDRFLADGLAEYAQSRIVERIFDRRLQRMNYSLAEVRVFGGFVPWAIRTLRLDRQTLGIGRPAFRNDPAVDLRDARRSVRPAQAAKTAAALVTLERYLGWPALQRGLAATARTFAGKPMPMKAFASTMGDAADRDLSWFFDQVFSSRAVFDYSVDGLTNSPEADSRCGASSCYRSTVMLGRKGAAMFTGTSTPPVGDFESGRALSIEVTFADGQKIVDYWDGRASSKTLEYQSPSPVVSARIDPGRTLLLDVNALNNVLASPPASKRATLPWAVRWTTWLEDAMQTAAFFF